MAINYFISKSEKDSYYFAAKKINEILLNNSNKSIAVISKTNKKLTTFSEYLDYFKIIYRIEKTYNYLENKYLLIFLEILKLIRSINSENYNESSYYFKNILKYDFCQIDDDIIWSLSIESYNNKLTWLEVLDLEKFAKSDSYSKIIRLKKVFFHLAIKYGKELSFDDLIVYILGINDVEIIDELGKKVQINTNFKNYYYNTQNQDDFIHFIDGLTKLKDSIINFNAGKKLSLEIFIQTVDHWINSGIRINNTLNLSNNDSKVDLISAHKSKGLEFDYVFLLDFNKKGWFGKNKNISLKLPINLPLLPETEDINDSLRLLFVAITRAKQNLFLINYSQDESGREVEEIEFVPESIVSETVEDQFIEERVLLNNNLLQINTQIYPKSYQLIKHRINNYKLNISDIFSYVDIVNSSPQEFLEKRLLRFPSLYDSSKLFGTMMHYTIETFYKQYSNTQIIPDLESLYLIFETKLKQFLPSSHEFDTILYRGKANLEQYYYQKLSKDDFNYKIEYSFASQDVFIKDVPVSGQIDKMRIDEINKQIIVYDYKTGSKLDTLNISQNKSEDYKSIKAWKFGNQINFYKLLIENSRDFGGKYTVKSGVIEFIEPRKNDDKYSYLQKDIDNEEINYLIMLIEAVSNKITNLDFVDVSRYTQDLDGIHNFCEDLINKNI
jgi:DNA helicase-2/ATP-dependent DNA helicase PcrA